MNEDTQQILEQHYNWRLDNEWLRVSATMLGQTGGGLQLGAAGLGGGGLKLGTGLGQQQGGGWT